jgi:uncharacterized protein (TIGR02646 family)
MMKHHRPNSPAWLKEKYEQWGIVYETNKHANPHYRFAWRQYQGQKINTLLLPLLIEMTSDHCSFCDGYPMKAFGGNSIEHFRPKSDPKFYRQAYQWENLFLCCYVCQGAKLEKFDEVLLKPDEIDYAFDQYFIVDLVTGIINPNPASEESDQERAVITIEMYGLNLFDRPETRKHFLLLAFANTDASADYSTYPYRFMYSYL